MKKSFRFYTGAGLRKLDGALVDGKVAVVSVENEFKVDKVVECTDVEENDQVVWDSDDGIVGVRPIGGKKSIRDLRSTWYASAPLSYKSTHKIKTPLSYKSTHKIKNINSPRVYNY